MQKVTTGAIMVMLNFSGSIFLHLSFLTLLIQMQYIAVNVNEDSNKNTVVAI